MTSSAIHETPAETTAGLRAEFSSLLGGCGACDLQNRAKLSLSGNDRVRWLNGMITNKVRDLPIGQGVYGFVLTVQGHILGDLYAYNRGESLVLDIDEAQRDKLLAIFRKYIIMDKVEIADLSEQLHTIGITGPKALTVLQAAGLDTQNLEPLHCIESTWQGAPVSIVRSDTTVDSYEIWAAPEKAKALRETLLKSGASSVGNGALELLRIASGRPRYGQDIGERDLPQETAQLRALHFAKGCYIGQEIVERIRSRGAVHRKFSGFDVKGPLPAPNTKIQFGGKDVGEITSGATLPLASGDRSVALGYVRREAADSGQPLQAGDAQLTVASVPFPGVFLN
ncbi:MAG TPA: folate-binding protein [Terriglobales bacterium]|nr:folate-binding protein [Terriglobales bacterium]